MTEDKKILATLVTLSGVLIAVLLGLNGFFLSKVFEKVDRTYEKATDAGQAVAVLTARFDTYIAYRKSKLEDANFGEGLRKGKRYHLVDGI